MGIESYFFNINIMEDVEKENVLEFIQCNFSLKPYYIKVKQKFFFKKIMYDNNRFILDESLILEVINNDYIVVILEGCFSNYEINIKKSYNVYSLIQSKYSKVNLSVGNNILTGYPSLGFEKFNDWILTIFEKKYNNFENLYGKLNIDVLPHEFYKYIKRKKIHD
jgi:hypothetical protein